MERHGITLGQIVLYHYITYIEGLIYLFQQGVKDKTTPVPWFIPAITRRVLENYVFKNKWGVVFNEYQNQTYLTLFCHVF